MSTFCEIIPGNNKIYESPRRREKRNWRRKNNSPLDFHTRNVIANSSFLRDMLADGKSEL